MYRDEKTGIVLEFKGVRRASVGWDLSDEDWKCDVCSGEDKRGCVRQSVSGDGCEGEGKNKEKSLL